MAERNAVVGICDAQAEADACIGELRGSGFDPGKVSVAGKGGALRGGLRSRLSGPDPFFIPGIGPLVVFGPLAGWVVDAIERAAVIGGLSTLGVALYGIGIPENAIIRYETALRSGRFLVIAHGSAEETARARDVLETVIASRIDIHPYLGGDRPAAQTAMVE
jgi:hypothetical protein